MYQLLQPTIISECVMYLIGLCSRFDETRLSRLVSPSLLYKAIYITIVKGSFKNYVDIILLIFDHPPTSMDTFYVINVDKNGKF